MLATDVNILLNAFFGHSPHHVACQEFLKQVMRSGQTLAVPDLVLCGFVRIGTNPRLVDNPAPLDEALRFVDALRSSCNLARLSPGSRHWQIFSDLCRQTKAKGNLVTDAFLAALAIESDCEWVSIDGDFGLFPDLRWRRLEV